MRTVIHLRDPQSGHTRWVDLWHALKPLLLSGQRFEIDVRPERRSTEQNSKLWAMLNEVAVQVEWYGRRLDALSWKHIFSAALKKQDVVPSLDGKGFVVLGQSTSQMSKAEMSELIELIHAFGAERGVEFHEEIAA